MDACRAGRCSGGTLIGTGLLVLFVSAGAPQLHGEQTASERPLVPWSLEELNSSTAPPPVRPALVPRTGLSLVVRVAWYDVEGLFEPHADLIAEHLSGLFRESGATLLWRKGEIGTSSEDVSADEVPVLLFATDSSPRGRTRRALGATTASRDTPRLVNVFLNPIRVLLGQPSSGNALSPDEARALARAVARVVAHELVHALAPEQAHRACGLMRHAFSRADLLIPLGTADAQMLRALLTASSHAAAVQSRSQSAHN